MILPNFTGQTNLFLYEKTFTCSCIVRDCDILCKK